ncbi:protein of unknown function [Georgfuchsia toluolica]|uniref:MobA-like NTP transferase domain-containing protein n=1 Tax=Georgfuchsia toluolica TaxID=424218 RepID=A0A916J3E9_9PROT|nr:hypothetical protein [Georgfuchsia toluolica]CAG4883246.1 protein of unknown function [Georgfuchsia toluolica]
MSGHTVIVGILLAAGAASRFGSGKLIAELPDGCSVGEVACAALRPAAYFLNCRFW